MSEQGDGNGGDDGGLPEPEIETIRNIAAHSYGHDDVGAILRLGSGQQSQSVDVRLLASVATHYERLVRIVRIDRTGYEVKRKGRLLELKDAPVLAAMPAAAGSFVLPLRLESSDQQTFFDAQELSTAVSLLNGTNVEAILRGLPERAGDELEALLKTIGTGGVQVEAAVVVENEISALAHVAPESAQRRATQLGRLEWVDGGETTLHGHLFEIDAKHWRLTLEVSAGPDADDPDLETVEMLGTAGSDEQVLFPPEMWDALYALLRKDVEIDVSVQEQRRHYERLARSRRMTVTAVRPMGT